MLVHLSRIFCCLLLTAGIVLPALAKADAAKISYCLNNSNYEVKYPIQECTWGERRTLSLSEFLSPVKWIRIESQGLLDGEKPSKNLAIHIAPHFISSIELFKSSNAGGITLESQAGSHYSSRNPHDIIGGYLFITEVEPSASTIYLRTKSYISGYVSVTVGRWPSNELQSQLGLGLHLGALVLLWIYALGSYLHNKNALLARLSLFLTCSLISVLSGSGILAHTLFVDNTWLDLIVFAAVSSIRLGLWIYLCQAFLQPYPTKPWYRFSCHIGYAISLLCIFLSIGLNASIVQPLLISGTAFIGIVQIFAIAKTPNIETKYRQYLLFGFASVLGILFAMSITALIPAFPENLAIHFARITVLLPVILIAGLVTYQNRMAQQDLISMKNDLEAAIMRHEFSERIHNERRMLMDMLTHELKNPLATIALASGSVTAQLEEQSPEIRRRIYKINQAVGNMDAVIERCNLANTLTESAFEVYPREFNLRTLVNDLIESSKNPARIQLFIDSNAPNQAVSDPQLVQIILSNLIDNSLKYSPRDSLTQVSVTQVTKNQLRIWVCNQVDESLAPDAEKLFTRFYRHPAAHKTSGTGLGLFLVRNHCERLKGNVTCTIDNGLIGFSVELPI